MRTNPFDELTKSLASGTSRRNLLKVLAMTVGGGAVALLSASSEAAPKDSCRGAGQTCDEKRGRLCCPGLTCTPKKNNHGSICA
jgi:hypothetical protein